MDINKTIGNNLKYFRYKSKLSQEKFYEQYNLNPKYLACIERGEINISVKFLFKLCETLNIPVEDLLLYDSSKIVKSARIDSKK